MLGAPYIFPACAGTPVVWFALVLKEGYSTARADGGPHIFCFVDAAQLAASLPSPSLRAGPGGQGCCWHPARQAEVVIRVRFCLVAGPCCQVLRRYMTILPSCSLLLDPTSLHPNC